MRRPFRYAMRGSGRARVRGRYHGCWDWLKGPFSAVSIVPNVSPKLNKGEQKNVHGILSDQRPEEVSVQCVLSENEMK